MIGLLWLWACCPDPCPELEEAVSACSGWASTPWGSSEAFTAWCPAWREEVAAVARTSEEPTCDARFDEVLALDCPTLTAYAWTSADGP